MDYLSIHNINDGHIDITVPHHSGGNSSIIYYIDADNRIRLSQKTLALANLENKTLKCELIADATSSATSMYLIGVSEA